LSCWRSNDLQTVAIRGSRHPVRFKSARRASKVAGVRIAGGWPYADLPTLALTTVRAELAALPTEQYRVDRRAAMRRPTIIPTGIVKMNQTATTSNSISCDLSAAFDGSGADPAALDANADPT
jgi:hypothetical protein